MSEAVSRTKFQIDQAARATFEQFNMRNGALLPGGFGFLSKDEADKWRQTAATILNAADKAKRMEA